MSRLSLTVSALALLGAMASIPAHAVQRVFVASFGNDANTATNCNFANPCRGFTAAMTVVDAGGEVVALDAAGYGAVTLTKSVTLTANPGFYAGISASTGNAVTIATAGVSVILRNLNLNGIGAANGVNMTNGAKLAIENCVISNFTNAAVSVATPARARIVDSVLRDNGYGISVNNGATAIIAGMKILGTAQMGVNVIGSPTATNVTVAISDSIISGPYVGIYGIAVAGATANISVSRSTLSNGVYGVAIEGSGTILTIGNSQVTGNENTGLYQSGATTLRSLANNMVDQNGSNTSGTITVISGL
jgi:hypothetical protein